MLEDPAKFAVKHTDEAAAARNFNANQLFNRETPGMFLVHRCRIVQPVKVRQTLKIGLVLEQLLGASMQQADMAIDPVDQLTIQIHHHAQHAVRGRMLRPEVQREGTIFLRNGFHIVSHYAPSSSVVAFSSPGISAVMPSHGERKSKLRYSCAS